eukprot:4501440-Prymnesium_polylepis.1
MATARRTRGGLLVRPCARDAPVPFSSATAPSPLPQSGSCPLPQVVDDNSESRKFSAEELRH